MPTAAPVILLEFNELTLSLVEQFMAEGRLPNFQRFYRESQAYITDAGEEQRYLDPWVQWVTVHTGLSPEQHGILRLGEGHKLAYQSIWDLVSAAGRSVWVCGSMNVKHDMPLRGYVLPDPWTTETTPYPTDLWPYFRF